MKELQARLDKAEASTMKGDLKIIQKLENRVHELGVEVESEQHRYQELKIKMFKRQVEDSEERAAITMAKYRKVQHDLEESGKRAD